MTRAQDISDELIPQARQLRDAIPEVWSAYAALHRAAMAPGALDIQTKELIALAVAVAKQCDGCIVAHARAAARRGVSEQAVAEALGVVVLLNGGPGTVYGPRALAAFREFAAGGRTPSDQHHAE